MSVINQTKKYELTLVAISTKDKLNKNHKKCGEFFTDGKTIY
jgi:hypothetical protein